VSGVIEGLAERAAAHWRARIADRLRARGIPAHVRPDGVLAEGRRLKARWLNDARLRWIGGWS
jgi:hypothetical protein